MTVEQPTDQWCPICERWVTPVECGDPVPGIPGEPSYPCPDLVCPVCRNELDEEDDGE